MIWRFALSVLLGEFFSGGQNDFQCSNGSTHIARVNLFGGFGIEGFQSLVEKIFSFFLVFFFQFTSQSVIRLYFRRTPSFGDRTDILSRPADKQRQFAACMNIGKGFARAFC